MSTAISDALSSALATLDSAGVTPAELSGLYPAQGALPCDAQLTAGGLLKILRHAHEEAVLEDVAPWVKASIVVGGVVFWCRRELDDLSDKERARVVRIQPCVP